MKSMRKSSRRQGELRPHCRDGDVIGHAPKRHTASELAWDLVEQIRSHLDVAQLNAVFVKLGVGDYEFVIRLVLRWLPRIGVSLTPDLLSRSRAWIDGYRDHTDYPRLLELLAAFR
jgi:hypothetical protein